MNALRVPILRRALARTLAVSAVLALLAVPTASAQQSGGARAPAGNGGAQGTVGSGAANHGGAGGVANPSPGGGRASAGEPGNSEGPTGTVTQRSGYLGGRDSGTSDEDGSGTTSTTTINTTTSTGIASEPNCHNFNPASIGPTERLSGENRVRIEDVRALVAARTVAGGQRRTSRYLLANFQEELAKPSPDLEAAAAYLGIAAQEPVTPKLVMRVSQILCVPMAESEAERISRTAENQRLRVRRRK